jgi:hypothetical protein
MNMNLNMCRSARGIGGGRFLCLLLESQKDLMPTYRCEIRLTLKE